MKFKQTGGRSRDYAPLFSRRQLQAAIRRQRRKEDKYGTRS